jgi:hypothetical protein
MKPLRYKTIIAASAILALFACKENTIYTDDINDEANRKLSFAAPLINLSFSADDMIREFADSGMFYKDENDLIYYSYNHDLSFNWENMVTLKDVNLNKTYSAPLISFIGGRATYSFTEKVALNTRADMRIDSLILASGLLNLTAQAPSGSSGTITITIPELKRNNVPLTYRFTVTSANRSFTIQNNLRDVKAILSQETGSSYITINGSIDLSMSAISPVAINLNMSQLTPSEAFGYFGKQSLDTKNFTLEFDIFNEFDLTQKVLFKDYLIKLSAYNPIGVPFEIAVDSVWFSKDDVNSWKLKFYDKNSLTLKPATYGKPPVDSYNYFNISSQNSNIQDISSKYPDKMVCNIKSLSNPQNNGQPNFITNKRNLKSNLSINFPFWFKTQQYNRADTVDFDFNDMVEDMNEEVDNVEDFKIYLDFYNEFPFEIGAQLYAADNNYNVIEPLLSANQKVILSAKPSTSGSGNESVHSQMIISINADQIKRFKARPLKYLIIKTNAITYNNGQDYVKLFGSDKLKASVSANISGKLPE